MSINSLPKNKISDQPKSKEFADDKIKVIENSKSVEGRIENIVGKGENAGCKSKEYADDKIKVIENSKSVEGRIENIVGKGENAGYQYFLFSHNVSKRLISQGR